jgi:hypothetical protein
MTGVGTTEASRIFGCGRGKTFYGGSGDDVRVAPVDEERVATRDVRSR